MAAPTPSKRPETKLLVCARYGRISPTPESEVGANYSIPSQNHETLECAKKRGYYTDDSLLFIDDNYSGTTLDRPALERVRQLIRDRAIDVLLVYSLDRLVRGPAMQFLLKDECDKHCVRLEFVNEQYADNPEGNLLFGMKGVINEYERLKLRERTDRCRREKAREGHVVASAVPYGFIRIGKKQGSRGEIIVDEERAAVVRMIFAWAGDPNMGPTAIAKRLNQDGIKSARAGRCLGSKRSGKTNDGRWSRTTIYQMIINRAYIGEFQETICGVKKVTPCPAIVDVAVFNRAKLNLKNNGSKRTGRPSTKFELSGYGRCKRCGHRLATGGGDGSLARGTYRCGHLDEKDRTIRHCFAAGISARALQTTVWSTVWKNITDEKVLKAWVRAYYGGVEDTQKGPDPKVRLVSLLKAEKRAMDILYDPESSVAPAEATKRLKAIQAEISVVKDEIKSRENVVAMPTDSVIAAFCREILAPGEPTELADRREIYSHVLDRVYWDDRKRTVEIHGKVTLSAQKCYSGVNGDNTFSVSIPFFLKERVA